MKDFSILIGGRAGDGIDKASVIIGQILSYLGYYIYIHRDYPSLIRGGHTFSIIRASEKKVSAHKEETDILIALNSETLSFHRNLLKNNCFYIYDSGIARSDGVVCGIGIDAGSILKQENAPEFTRNVCLIGAFCKAAGIDWTTTEKF